MGILDFFSPEAGQRRRAWLDEQSREVGGVMDYYLGPTGIPDKLQAVAGLLDYTDAGDMPAAAEASRNMWNNPSVGNAAQLTAAGAALALPIYSQRLGQGIADTADELVKAYDPSVTRSIGPKAKEPLTPSQQQSQEVLNLLGQGRGSEVTDDMMAAADDMYLAQNYDLPLDEASRMGRAREMGFEGDYYKGAKPNYDDFMAGQDGSMGAASYLTPYPEVADRYSQGAVYPVSVRGDIVDTSTARPSDYRAISDAARSDGASGASRDWDVAVFDPVNIRSRFARFDPRLSHLRNLSAGVGGMGLLSQFGNEDEEELRRYLEQVQ